MLQTKNFKIRPLPSIVFGIDCSRSILEHVIALNGRSVLIVTDRGLMSGPIPRDLRRFVEQGIDSIAIFDGAEPNPTDANVMDGAKLLRGLKDPVVVAVGGGSAMDCGKAIALLGPNEGTVEGLQSTAPNKAGIPVIAIPTTAGTGSETNSACVITNLRLGRKTYVSHPSIVPKIALLDPSLTVGLPPYPTATCGFDVLTHAIEAFTSNRATPYSDPIALRAIQIVAENLKAAVKNGDNLEARSELLLASSMAAVAFNVAGLGAAHGTGHALSARLGVAHGQTLATMLPHVMAFNSEYCMEKYEMIATVMKEAVTGSKIRTGTAEVVETIMRFREELGLDKSIRDLGGNEDLLPLLVADAAADSVNRTNIRTLDQEAFERLYRAAC
ncbi:iron-containing alcohol dehydrogenase family protein (plasmid) [Nitrobacteraceae bacterium UC4446_H13]